jgi:hypothetical protein
MRRVLACTLAGSILAAVPARAVQAIPQINSGAYCDEMAEFTDNELLKKQCLENESHASREVQSKWTELPDQVRTKCSSSLALATPSYQGLSSCLNGMMILLWREGKAKAPPQ